MLEHKLFTRSEANALLPQLKEDLRKLQETTLQFERLYVEYQKTRESYKHVSASADGSHDPFFELESKLDFMKMETDLLIENFTRKGVLLKMINPGLIDFPSVLNGEEILICWKEGEESATHYHSWQDGYAGRRPFPQA